jgi:hypothetical protein
MCCPSTTVRGIPDFPAGGISTGADLKREKGVIVIPQQIDSAAGPPTITLTRARTRGGISTSSHCPTSLPKPAGAPSRSLSESLLYGNFIAAPSNTQSALPRRFLYIEGADVALNKRITASFDLYGQRLFGASQLVSGDLTDFGLRHYTRTAHS